MDPYYADDSVQLWLGDCREIVPTLDVRPDCVVADPPYGETELRWDRWPERWPAVLADVSSSMWCFGSLRMFLDRFEEFADWRMSHDVVWQKPMGSSMRTDRFMRVHELAVHWYRGRWDEQRREVPRERWHGADKGVKRQPPGRFGQFGSRTAAEPSVDDGTRLMRSVVAAGFVRGAALHPTEKPSAVLDPLIRYACPPGGQVLDPFAGSGSTAIAARMSGRRAVLVEADERYCEVIARRLAQDVLPIGGGP